MITDRLDAIASSCTIMPAYSMGAAHGDSKVDPSGGCCACASGADINARSKIPEPRLILSPGASRTHPSLTLLLHPRLQQIRIQVTFKLRS